MLKKLLQLSFLGLATYKTQATHGKNVSSEKQKKKTFLSVAKKEYKINLFHIPTIKIIKAQNISGKNLFSIFVSTLKTQRPCYIRKTTNASKSIVLNSENISQLSPFEKNTDSLVFLFLNNQGTLNIISTIPPHTMNKIVNFFLTDKKTTTTLDLTDKKNTKKETTNALEFSVFDHKEMLSLHNNISFDNDFSKDNIPSLELSENRISFENSDNEKTKETDKNYEEKVFVHNENISNITKIGHMFLSNAEELLSENREIKSPFYVEESTSFLFEHQYLDPLSEEDVLSVFRDFATATNYLPRGETTTMDFCHSSEENNFENEEVSHNFCHSSEENNFENEEASHNMVFLNQEEIFSLSDKQNQDSSFFLKNIQEINYFPSNKTSVLDFEKEAEKNETSSSMIFLNQEEIFSLSDKKNQRPAFFLTNTHESFEQNQQQMHTYHLDRSSLVRDIDQQNEAINNLFPDLFKGLQHEGFLLNNFVEENNEHYSPQFLETAKKLSKTIRNISFMDLRGVYFLNRFEQEIQWLFPLLEQEAEASIALQECVERIKNLFTIINEILHQKKYLLTLKRFLNNDFEIINEQKVFLVYS